MNEYIKREDAIKICEGEIQNIRYMTDVYGKRFEAVVGARRINADEIAEQIKEIPSADVAECKTGRWTDSEDLICYKCSACGMYANQGYGLNEPIFWDYCPNCGADMRGER